MIPKQVQERPNICRRHICSNCGMVLQEDGSIHYMNLQSSTGTMFPEEGYSFCFSDGSVPDLTKLDEEYLNIGGAHD